MNIRDRLDRLNERIPEPESEPNMPPHLASLMELVEKMADKWGGEWSDAGEIIAVNWMGEEMLAIKTDSPYRKRGEWPLNPRLAVRLLDLAEDLTGHR